MQSLTAGSDKPDTPREWRNSRGLNWWRLRLRQLTLVTERVVSSGVFVWSGCYCRIGPSLSHFVIIVGPRGHYHRPPYDMAPRQNWFAWAKSAPSRTKSHKFPWRNYRRAARQ